MIAIRLIDATYQCILLPHHINQHTLSTHSVIEPKKYLEEYVNPDKRATFCEFFSLTADETNRLLLACRDNGNNLSRRPFSLSCFLLPQVPSCLFQL